MKASTGRILNKELGKVSSFFSSGGRSRSPRPRSTAWTQGTALAPGNASGQGLAGAQEGLLRHHQQGSTGQTARGCRRTRRKVGNSRDSYPLSVDTVYKFAGVPKVAGFRSAEMYLAELKMGHVEADMVVGPALQRAFDQAKRALLRGKGPARRAPSFSFRKWQSGEGDRSGCRSGVPLLHLLHLPALHGRSAQPQVGRLGHFRRREIRDPHQEAAGVSKTLGCVCNSTAGRCPVHHTVALRKLSMSRWPDLFAENGDPHFFWTPQARRALRLAQWRRGAPCRAGNSKATRQEDPEPCTTPR